MKIIIGIAFFLLILCSACSHQQTATAPYPIWGDAVYLTAPASGQRRILQWLAPPKNAPVLGCLLIVHGMNEHIGRYGPIARHFANRFFVAGIDLTAHGLSNTVLAQANNSIVKGAKSYDVGNAFLEQARIRDLQPMRGDVKLALKYLSAYCQNPKNQKPLPIFILSHSLGSLVSSSYLLQAKQDPLTARVEGIILSGPAFSVTEVPGWRGWFQNPVVDFTFYTHDHFLHPHEEPAPILLFNQFIALVTVPLQDGIIELVSLPGLRQVFSPTAPAWVRDYLTDSEAERELMDRDSYMLKRSVMRYVLAVEKEIISFRRKMAQFDSPYLLIYSEHDPITPAWGSADFAVATRLNNADNRVMLLAGKSHHEQLFSAEPLRTRILALIDGWLDMRLNNLKNNRLAKVERVN